VNKPVWRGHNCLSTHYLLRLICLPEVPWNCGIRRSNASSKEFCLRELRY
ncbi:hypothetical protein QYM36_020045, partial [Artemia franciscana]